MKVQTGLKQGFIVTMAVAATGVAAQAGVPLARLPVNRWAAVYDGPPGIIGVHARFLWLPDAKAGFLWPNCNYNARAFSFEQHAQLHFFSPEDGRWTARPSTFPAGLRIHPEMIGQSYVHLPEAGRILVLQQGSDRRKEQWAFSWLLDPAAGRWEALQGDLRFCDQSADFNPAKGADGWRVPLWGALCYDAHSKEAVAVGGGGTWGRVGKQPEKVRPGEWIYDETAEPKRIRRLTAKDHGKVRGARKWYPANCGTWTFSARAKTWTPIAQPLAQ